MIKAAIMELNPFHNGHAYFLSQIPKTKDDILIVIISTTVVQRGEITVLNKHDKAQLLLDHHADIVIALPSLLANQGGDYFAYHAIDILNQLNIDELYFGSESGDIDFLNATPFNRTKDFKNGIYNTDNEKFKANDILGVSYLKAIDEINPKIRPHLIKRIANNYNDSTINSNIASATSIRQNLKNKELIRNTLPEYSFNKIQTIDEALLFELFKNNLNLAIINNINIFLSEGNQLLYRLQKIVTKNPKVKSCQEIAELAKDKNNTKYKYQRVMINTILLVPETIDLSYDYIHLLGFSNNGQQYLKQINNAYITNSLKVTNCPLALYEKHLSNLYNSVTKQNLIHDYLPPKINYDKINE